MAHPPGQQSLRGDPGFVRWATAEGISMVGTAVSTVVLPLVVYDATGSATLTGVLFALRVVPYLVFGLVAGAVADRGNRRRLIIGGNVAEGLLIATIPAAHALGVLTVAQVYVVALASATVFVFSDAAVFAAVPALVGPERLPAANGFLGSLTSGAEIMGPALGGLLAVLFGPTNAIWLDATSFVVAAAVQRTIRSDFRTDPIDASAPRVRLAVQVRRALSFVRHHRTLAALIVIGFGNSFAFGAVLGLTVPYAVEHLGLDRHDGRIGVLFSAAGIGSLMSGLAFARVYRTERIRWLTPVGISISAAAVLLLVSTRAWTVALLASIVFSWAVSTTITTGITYRQLVAPDDLRSSVNVVGRMVAWGGQPFGAAIGAVIAGTVSVGAAYAAATAIMGLTALGAWVALAGRPTTL